MKPESFSIEIPQFALDDLQRRLRDARWSEDFAERGLALRRER